MKHAAIAKPTLAGHGITADHAPSHAEFPTASIPLWYRPYWRWFFSLGVGVLLLLLITIASIAGTMIDPLERAQQMVFYTWWYKLMLVALAVNMACTTVKTLMTKVLPTRGFRVHSNKGFFNSEHLTARVPFQGSVDEAAAAFRAQGFKVETEGQAGMARTGWLGSFGAPVSHVGLITVLLAGFVASWVAKEAIVQIPEGRTATNMQMRTGNQEVMPLGFFLTVNDFDTGFHPRTRIPSHYVSDIIARDEHERVLYSGPVEVNHSPKINGWRLHQTSYQELPNQTRYEVQIAGGSLVEPVTTKISLGQTRVLPGIDRMELAVDNRANWTLLERGQRVASGSLIAGAAGNRELVLLANRFEPDFVLGEDRAITSRSQNLNNPALHVTLIESDVPVASQWLFGREDMRGFSHAPAANYRMELVDVQRTETGDAFVVAVSDAQSGLVLSRVLLGLGEEKVISRTESDAHAGCSSCDDHGDDGKEATIAGVGDGNVNYSVTLGPRVPAYATVLTLTRNPTIPVIYFGCVLMMVGLVMAFAVPRRNVWFLRDPEKNQLIVAARYRHSLEEFDRATQSAITRLAAADAAPSTSKDQ